MDASNYNPDRRRSSGTNSLCKQVGNLDLDLLQAVNSGLDFCGNPEDQSVPSRDLISELDRSKVTELPGTSIENCRSAEPDIPEQEISGSVDPDPAVNNDLLRDPEHANEVDPVLDTCDLDDNPCDLDLTVVGDEKVTTFDLDPEKPRDADATFHALDLEVEYILDPDSRSPDLKNDAYSEVHSDDPKNDLDPESIGEQTNKDDVPSMQPLGSLSTGPISTVITTHREDSPGTDTQGDRTRSTSECTEPSTPHSASSRLKSRRASCLIRADSKSDLFTEHGSVVNVDLYQAECMTPVSGATDIVRLTQLIGE